MDEITSHVKTFREMTLDEKVAYALKHSKDDYIPSWSDIDVRYAELRECKNALFAFIKDKVIYKIARDIQYLNEKGIILLSEGLDRCNLFTYRPNQLNFEKIKIKYIKNLQNKTYRSIISDMKDNPEVRDRQEIRDELAFCGDVRFSVDKDCLCSSISKVSGVIDVFDSIELDTYRLWYAFLPSFIKK